MRVVIGAVALWVFSALALWLVCVALGLDRELTFGRMTAAWAIVVMYVGLHFLMDDVR